MDTKIGVGNLEAEPGTKKSGILKVGERGDKVSLRVYR